MVNSKMRTCNPIQTMTELTSMFNELLSSSGQTNSDFASERQTIKNYESETCTFLATFNQKYQMALLNIK